MHYVKITQMDENNSCCVSYMAYSEA